MLLATVLVHWGSPLLYIVLGIIAWLILVVSIIVGLSGRTQDDRATIRHFHELEEARKSETPPPAEPELTPEPISQGGN